ncbi:aminoglycoside 6-adenylyltransferase [Georgenia sp. TF02-10]|uniref:aminoglycoside 6-adenylyltransferase n=1 Tax=Georgenia sp. TF02-10 TaxID=2917725 RepID=UPI001FA7DF66|nr:aminoglycoside 6-adenylyltransferase [Georgenia sp. TF02-10]UNX56136.1 aminoglycoside 6-adenylyltransferase [Georgenia sp. TF02-10]
MDYSCALEALIRWAQGHTDVRALVLTGSAAAEAAHPLSDRDIEVFTTDVEALLRDESWWSDLGEVLVVERLEDGGGNPTRLIYYAGGKLDFTLLPAPRLTGRVYARPFRVLLDKDGAAATASLSTSSREPPSPPSAAEFEESINWAWAAALMQAKAIVRDEPWSAKLRDQDLKAELLRMIEWDHHAQHGAGLDTRYLGTRMRQWMDTDIQHALEHCWGGLDGDDSTRALLATTELYRTLAERTATALGLPRFDHERVEAEMHTILDFHSA